ncbi:hypothetical protein [Sphingopyxis macrogoltabida]|uniref:Uncharacterized protein n=1 Tax=Sphingopyxis macrogoltabida TaxID=33050 RepID=A0AAC8Z1D5_SPHMC|nr:hypothetical protein [Sphingopyxis macrogoltabida]ALJ12643.1 hypothetical protein LH19_07165 [Sphingopyxis macrogoltabida]AMU89889.1 hypothetical protein ATM17_12670 [Sphingopyxis macrogoltabida]
MDIGNLGKKIDLNPGTWIEDVPDMEGVRFLVRSTNFKPFKIASAGLARRSGKKLRTDAGVVNFAVTMGSALAEHILLDWDGVTENGKPLKYDAKKALALLTADDDFGIGDAYRRAVEWAGDQVAERIAETAEEAAGN